MPQRRELSASIVGGRRRPGRDLAGDRNFPPGAPGGTDEPICDPGFWDYGRVRRVTRT